MSQNSNCPLSESYLLIRIWLTFVSTVGTLILVGVVITSKRYRYLYSPEEIKELGDRITATAEETAVLFAHFNNHWQGYVPKNATDLKKALNLPLVELMMQDNGIIN